jgi:putative aldouronate transport system permease protein
MTGSNASGSKVFSVFNYVFLFGFAIITILPFVYIVAGSFSASEALTNGGFILFPTKFSLKTYEYIFSSSTLIRSLGVTIFITVCGTLINMIFTVMMAYPLAHSDFLGRKSIMVLVTFTMMFTGGMIPTFLVVKSMGMLNTYWALIIPGAISAFNLIILKNFFQQLPPSLEESARIDGYNDLSILVRIIIPLSLPAIATFSLFYAVGHWNSFLSPILYINDSQKWPIQVLLRQIVIMAGSGIGDSSQLDADFVIPAQTVKMATIVAATAPILLVYPFLQKYFTQGILLGSVKG